jgi:4-amino-4-deoxy-L-arabinose transferase-like glycosyltransferase
MKNIYKILIGSLILRVIILCFFNTSNLITGDSIGYNEMAIHLLHYHNLRVGLLDQLRPLGYPVIIAIIYYIFGVRVLPIIIFHITLSLLTSYFIYRIGKKLFNEKVGIIAAILFSLNLDIIFNSFIIYSDTLLLFFIVLSFWMMIENRIIFAFIYLTAAVFVKPIIMYLPICYAGYILFCMIKDGRLKTLYKLIIGIIIFYTLMGTWCYRNYLTYGHYKYTTGAGCNFYGVIMFYMEMEKTGIPFTYNSKDWTKVINTVSDKFIKRDGYTGDYNNLYNMDFKQENRMMDTAMSYIKHNKLLYLKVVSKNYLQLNFGMSNFWYADFLTRPYIKERMFLDVKIKHSYSYLAIYLIFQTIGITTLILYLIGCFWSCWNLRFDERLWLILMMIFYFSILTSLIIFGGGRLRMPLISFYAILTAYFIDKKIKL